ncbi:hypothetical protein P4U05_16985 [Bacillus paranthracis]|uniref:hypothetical protein n=1 Tax=Bacillus phage phi4B1 TaxID=1643324 RepID=UPI000200F41F|nr:hypothetical protein [Bacillus paranthracis]YP_009206355.1 hypothetical protein XO26_0056 [Bacillus phage phi4B1]ADY20351.1 hypothetical protein YBT020_05525 [Bacillus thuringiensis serovar finitimus YBT-020]MRC72841.1 hypothetical protein [Bacillus thuringiensis]OTX71293.1 hypothetical protein BK722_12835 [Bacillus thuringiensis serovar finitimus]ALF02586.1 hypothetical protein XO26_0056 [Bacillus phage phi4B1]MCR6799372.1 hypothetical protein [Bacillus paranthracis]
MKIESFKIPMYAGWPFFRVFCAVVIFWTICCLIAIIFRRESVAEACKSSLLFFKVILGMILFITTLLFDNFTEGVLYLKFPEEITLIQIFVLLILLVDICTSFIDIFDKK